MSVIRLKWNDLLTDKPLLTKAEFDNLFEQIDNLLVGKIDSDLSVYLMKNIYDDVVDSYLTPNNENVWKDLDIWLSSFKQRDKRIFNQIKLKLLQYLGFYKRILTDNGVARSVITHRTYSDKNVSSGENSSAYSETPQVNIAGGSIPTLDELMEYLSNVTKNKDDIETNRDGESDLDVKSKTWDEEHKNLNMIFYNTLCEYIASIPKIIYNYYSLDTNPVPDLVSKSFEYFRSLKDIYERR